MASPDSPPLPEDARIRVRHKKKRIDYVSGFCLGSNSRPTGSGYTLVVWDDKTVWKRICEDVLRLATTSNATE